MLATAMAMVVQIVLDPGPMMTADSWAAAAAGGAGQLVGGDDDGRVQRWCGGQIGYGSRRLTVR